MNKAKVQLIQGELNDAKALKNSLEKYNYSVIPIANTIENALGLFYYRNPDIIIIDVFLQGIPNGIAFAENINKNAISKKPVIFLTDSEDHKIFNAAKSTLPFSYLLKPFNAIELYYTIELALERAKNNIPVFSSGQCSYITDEYFFIRKKESLVKVPIHSIDYIEVSGRYLSIHSNNGNFLVKLPLIQILDKLPKKQFMRINRNVIVNLDKVLSINLIDNQVILDNDKRIAISSRNKEIMMKLFDILK